MSGVDTAYATGFVDSEVARVNSPPFVDKAVASETQVLYRSTHEQRDLRPTPRRGARLHCLRAPPAARASTGVARPPLGPAADRQPGAGHASARDRALVQRS